MTAGPAASRRVGINGRTSPPPDSSLPKVCSFQLPKVCSFRLPLTRYAHPTENRKVEAMDSFTLVTNWSHGRCDGEKKLVDRKGLEPSTSALRTRRSPS